MAHGHKCLKPKLYVLEGMELFEVEPLESEVEVEQLTDFGEANVQDCVGVVSILVLVLVGAPSPKTMRILGQIKKRKVTVLVDTGSAHNFVDTTILLKCGLSV